MDRSAMVIEICYGVHSNGYKFIGPDKQWSELYWIYERELSSVAEDECKSGARHKYGENVTFIKTMGNF